MAIENSVSNDFLSTFLDSIGVFNCRLPGVYILSQSLYGYVTGTGRRVYNLSVALTLFSI